MTIQGRLSYRMETTLQKVSW